MYAVENGNTDLVKILLEHGADANTKNIDGQLVRVNIIKVLI